MPKRRFHLEVTGACNLRCLYCYNSGFSTAEQVHDELTFEEQLTLIEQAVAMGCNKFVFSGGEPFVYDRIFDLIEHCPAESYVSVITNASRLGVDTIGRLDRTPQFRELKTSWDGFQAHDRVRLGSSHEQVEAAIRLARTRAPRLNVIINTMMNAYSAGELCQLYEALKALGVGHWRIDMPFNYGRCTENGHLVTIPFEEIILTYRNLLQRYFADGKPMMVELFNVYKSMINTDVYFEFDDSVHPCAYYNNTVTVRPNGDLTYCPSLSFALANWRESRDLATAEACAAQHPYCSLALRDISECGTCRYLKLCGGGCRADAVTWGHGPSGPDPINCSMMPLIEQHIVPILPAAERAVYERYIDGSKQAPCSFQTAADIPTP